MEQQNSPSAAYDHDPAGPWTPLDPPGGGAAPEQPLASAAVDLVGNAVVVRVAGEVDQYTAPGLRQLLIDQVDRGLPLVVVDVTHVEFIASSGLAALLAAERAAGRAGVGLRLACLPRPVRRLLEVAGLTSLFAVYDDVPAALRDRPARPPDPQA